MQVLRKSRKSKTVGPWDNPYSFSTAHVKIGMFWEHCLLPEQSTKNPVIVLRKCVWPDKAEEHNPEERSIFKEAVPCSNSGERCQEHSWSSAGVH